jgi:hypothetical protein
LTGRRVCFAIYPPVSLSASALGVVLARKTAFVQTTRRRRSERYGPNGPDIACDFE